MRKKSVRIRVSCRQIDEAGEEIFLSYDTSGEMGERGSAAFLTYEEPESSGLLGTRTTLFFSDDAVRLVRTGSVSLRLLFSPNQTSEGIYRTDMGSFVLRAKVHRLDNEIVGAAGRLRIVYTLEAEGFFSHENELMITILEDVGFHGH